MLACAGPTLAGAARAARDGATIATPVHADFPDAQRVRWRPYNGKPRGSRLIRMAPWFDDGTLSVRCQPGITGRTLPMRSARSAEGHTRGKVVLIVDDDLAAELEV